MAVRERTTKGGAKRFDVIVRGDDGRQYVRTFAKRDGATKFEQSERVARDQGKWIDPRAGAVTFETWAEGWLVNDISKRPSTVARDTAIIERRPLPAFGRREAARSVSTSSAGSSGRTSPPPAESTGTLRSPRRGVAIPRRSREHPARPGKRPEPR